MAPHAPSAGINPFPAGYSHQAFSPGHHSRCLRILFTQQNVLVEKTSAGASRGPTVNSQQMHSVYFASEPFQKAPFCWWAPQRDLFPIPSSYRAAAARCRQTRWSSAAAVVPPAPITPSLGAVDQRGPYLGLSLHPGAIKKCSQVPHLPLGGLLSPSVLVPALTEHPADAGEPRGPPPSPRETIMGLYFPPSHSSGTSRVLFYLVVPTTDSSNSLPSLAC